MRKDSEVKDLREKVELKRQQVEVLKGDVSRKIKKINEIESKHEVAMQAKEKELQSVTADYKANLDLVKETMGQMR